MRYRSVSVDSAGIKVAVGGVTVRPLSELSTGDGRPTTFGAENGLLTATTKGGNPDGSPTPIVLYAKPGISGTKLVIAPQQIEMFGFLFPAGSVLAQVRARDTSYPLQVLPTNLEYRSVEVLAARAADHHERQERGPPEGTADRRQVLTRGTFCTAVNPAAHGSR